MLSREELLLLAREAGISMLLVGPTHQSFLAIWDPVRPTELSRFAELVAAKERKTCEVACAQAIEYAKGAERDAILSEIETGIWLDKTTEEVLTEIAAAIRARGEKGGA